MERLDENEGRPSHSFRRSIAAGLLLVAALLVLPPVAVVAALWRGLPAQEAMAATAVVVLALIGGTGVLWRLWLAARRHFSGLERLRGLLLGLGSRAEGGPLAAYVALDDREVEELRAVILDLADGLRERRSRPDARLRAVLESVGEAIVVVTQDGLVSLVNGPAKALLGADRVAVGTSVFAALDRESVDSAMADARGANRPLGKVLRTVSGDPLEATVREFGEHGGAIITFAPSGQDGLALVLEDDLAMHERPPAPRALQESLSISDLPLVVFDCETTGLDVLRDRVISLGAVRMHGDKIYRGSMIDRLVDPGMPIPARSSAIHGITDAMVAGAPNFAAVEPSFRELTEGCLLVGHNVPFDIAMLRGEYEQAGMPWPDPRSIDLLQLVTALDPNMGSASLDALAALWGVEIRGRHTALGDALVTAEIYRMVLPRLQAEGVTNLGQLEAFCGQATSVIKRQKAMGW